jgi:hypothetical protein
VFKDFKNIDINLLPEPILPEEPAPEEKKGLLGGLFGKKSNPESKEEKK